MLHKWKSILINWINCYFNDDRKEQNLNLESLLNIITHLRDNLNLDESKSSKLSAHSVEEFITEKYPEFKFDNGTVEATNEEQVYLAASLLLYFVCVNSKDIDIKSAMCSKLSDRDQEIILKFSKSLLECSPILCRDVQTAIADACSHDVATVSNTIHVQVAETPPALRSLHGEVRRLQAALDAERFDRNYLQDELNRTNLRVEKLLKEKEEHKMDIVNLKTKISLCCGQEDEARGTESSSDKSAKLARQLQEMEERLVQTQGELDDAVYERDTYQAKVEELKQHCDKWLIMSQQETIRANQLFEELEIERRNTQSLRELVNELRQHNRLNRIDSSFLECDDPDASIQSLPHNSSTCSEVCANVIEVQLGEERAKIVVLKQQIQTLQDQINDLTTKSEDEKLTLESIISERETDIFNLKHRINEEIEEKNNLRAYFSDEMSKLNNEINELEQKLKDNNDNSRAMIENKMQDIQTLQEEKISLLQSLSDETTKLKNIIKDLKISIDTEKQSKMNMKESYDSHIMKLNEKMLNRNNELVELQNNVFEKSEMIESLHLGLRSEKEMNENLSKKYHDDIAHLNEQKNAIDHCLQERMHENSELQRILEQKTNMIEGLYREIDNLQQSLSHCNDNCRTLEEDNSKLLKEIYNRDNKLEEIYKDNENLKNVFSEERAIRDALECEKMQLIEEKQVLTIAVNEEKSAVDEMQNEKNVLSHKIDEISEQFNSELISKAKEIENVKSQIEHFKMDYHNQLQCNTKVTSDLNAGLERIKKNFHKGYINNEVLQKLLAADTTQKSIVDKCNLLMNIAETMLNEVKLKKKLEKALEGKNTALSEMQEIFKQKEMQIQDLQTDVKRINQVLNEKKNEMSKQTEVHTIAVSTKARELQQLQHENETLRNDLNDVKLQLEVKVHSLKEKLTDNEHLTDKLKGSYECQIDNLNMMINKLTAYLKEKTIELETTKKEKETLQHTIEENLKVIKSLETEMQTEKNNQEKLIGDFESERLVLKNMVTVTESVMEDQKINLDNIISEHAKINESLQEENKILKDLLETEKNNTKLRLQDKDVAIEKALKELAAIQEEKIKIEKELESQKENMDKEVTKLKDEINLKLSEIDELQADFKTIEESLQKHKDVIKLLEAEIQTEKKNQEKLISDFEAERLVLKNMVRVTESVMEDQKINLDKIAKINGSLQEEIIILKDSLETEKNNTKLGLQDKDVAIEKSLKKLATILEEKINIETELESQKDNMNKEVTKLRDEINLKSSEIDKLQVDFKTIGESLQKHKDVIKSLEADIQTEKKNQEKLISDFEAERLVLKNMVRVTESVMEDQKINLDNIIAEHAKINESLQDEIIILKNSLETEKNNTKLKLQDKDVAIGKVLKELAAIREEKINIEKELESQKENMDKEVTKLRDEINLKSSEIDKLQFDLKTIDESLQKYKDIMKSLENEIKTEKKNQEKLITDFESERLVLKNMVTVTESVMEDQKINLNNIISEHAQINESLQEENKILKDSLDTEKHNTKLNLQDKDFAIEKALKELAAIQDEKINIEKELESQKENMDKEVTKLRDEINLKSSEIDKLLIDFKTIEKSLQKHKDDLASIQVTNEKLKVEYAVYDIEVQKKISDMATELNKEKEINTQLQTELFKKTKLNENILKEVEELREKVLNVEKEKQNVVFTCNEWEAKYDELQARVTLNEKQMEEALEILRNENMKSVKTIEDQKIVITSLEQIIKHELEENQTLRDDNENEKLTLINKFSLLQDWQTKAEKDIEEKQKEISCLQEEVGTLRSKMKNYELDLKAKDELVSEIRKEKDAMINTISIELFEEKSLKEKWQKDCENKVATLFDREAVEIALRKEKEEFVKAIGERETYLASLQGTIETLKVEYAAYKIEIQKQINDMVTVLNKEKEIKTQLETELCKKTKLNENIFKEVEELREKVLNVEKEKHNLVLISNEWKAKFEELQARVTLNEKQMEEALETLSNDNIKSVKTIEDQKIAITGLEQIIKHKLEENQTLRDDNANEKLTLVNQFSLLHDWQTKAENDIEEKQKEISCLQEEVGTLQSKMENYNHDLKAKDELISEIRKEKDAIISTISRELLEEKTLKEKWQKECENKVATLFDREVEETALRKENEQLIKAIGERETFAVQNEEKLNKYQVEEERNHHLQVDNSSELSQSSMESLKTITDLEKIIHDKNRTITTLQSDITYLKTLMAESETKLMDVTNDLEVSKENCHQLSSQLKKIVYQKNEEIAELKKQVNKMSVTENRATQIIKVSAKYQAIILKRIAEIKSNTVLKELTNFGNTNNSDNELRRSLNVGTVTMEELENFLETTDKHLKRCSEKQIALQKERDRLSEVNRINESEIINLKKFLTELSVSFQTFNSMRDLYSHKLSRVVSIQRTVRREILNLDGHVTDACMCKMERGYAAVMQDLAECSMNLERWVERCVSRAISPEKIKQAFMGDYERVSLASTGFQNAGLEVQLEELDSSFQKLLEEVARATKGDGVRDAASVTVQEVRAEYEDKLNRMKAKMKQLYQEQIGVFKEKQREEVVMLEREVQKTREKLSESSRAYEEHIRALTTELWNVGEKFLMKKNESEWLRRKQRSGSLMSLQHVHSSGLVPTIEEPDRPSDSHSLRSLPVNNNANCNTTKREGRGLHMSDEEGEVFDNRFLKELSTPRHETGFRLSELKRRNSLCPPHLKSSYPAETQFAPALDEEDIKFAGVPAGRPQRKEVGITAYKKPGPPTPSKQAGRLSATDSELRESLRVEVDPLPSRKTSTPSRIRALFRTAKNETNEGTPRSRRLSNIFRKK